jgi:Ser-tRNA(Ala) deacylase AlaX
MAGREVRVAVDAARRRALSECHTAGHVVDAALAACGKSRFRPAKAYHYLEGSYVEYAGSVPVPERDKFLRDLQGAFDKLVRRDIATEIRLLDPPRADELCNRSSQHFDAKEFADPFTGRVRVVTVAGYSCPCGGTHVKSTGELLRPFRRWSVTGLKCKKGAVRVKYGYTALAGAELDAATTVSGP